MAYRILQLPPPGKEKSSKDNDCKSTSRQAEYSSEEKAEQQEERPNGRFSDGPEDPWTPVIELPLIHRESGEAFTFTAQSKTSLAAVKDFLGLCRRVSEGFLPIVRLDVGSFKGKFGQVKKPALSVIGNPQSRQTSRGRVRL